MASSRKPEESVAFMLNKLNSFCSAARNRSAGEEEVINSIRSMLNYLTEIVKRVDAAKAINEDLASRKKELADELNQMLSYEIFHRFDGYTPVHESSRLLSAVSFTQSPQTSLEETASQVKGISNKYDKLLAFLEVRSSTKSGEGSFVTKSPQENSVLIEEGELARFNRDKEQLIHLLFESGIKYVWVYGRRGSGKTTLVRKACEDVLLRMHFDTIAWISVPAIIDRDSIRHEIFLQLLFENKVPIPNHLSASDVNDEMLQKQIISLWQKERCLIVVDNLVDESLLKTFQNASYSVETGRMVIIARRVMGPLKMDVYWPRYEVGIYELRGLTEEESWALFCSKALPGGIVLPMNEQICYDIVSEWKGLPAAIELSSRIFHGLPRDKKEGYEAASLMEFLFDHIYEVRLIQQLLEIIYRDEILGYCFLYLSIFPSGQQISRMRISRLWTAEGFCDLGRVEHYLQKLLDRKWIHPVETRSDGGLSTFRVDDFVWKIIVPLSDHCNLARITTSGSPNWPERARYLSVQGTVTNLDEEKFSQLRSLFIFNTASSKYKTTMSEASLSETSENQLIPFNVKLLQVLDLTGAPPEIAPDAPPQTAPDALFESTCLKYLRLRDTSIAKIPKSIERLKHLEFLELKQTLVTELPREAEGLRRLRHILIYHHQKDPLMEGYNLIGFKALCSVGRFQCLEKLCFMEADEEALGDIGNLTKLMRLGITELREEHGELLRSSLEKLELLESLNLHAFDEDEIIDLHHLSRPPMSLKRLYLHCRLNKLPDWISKLDCLTKIVLRWSYLETATRQEEDLLATLGKLPELVELELRRAYNGRQLDFKDGQFPKLKILLLDELGRLRSMSLAKGTMPSLEDLTISRCPWLKGMPTGIEDIPKLKALEFFDMSPEFYKMVPHDYRNSQGKPKVYFTQWRPGQWKTISLEGVECHHYHYGKGSSSDEFEFSDIMLEDPSLTLDEPSLKLKEKFLNQTDEKRECHTCHPNFASDPFWVSTSVMKASQVKTE